MRRKLLAGTMVAIVLGAWICPSLPAQEPTSSRSKRVLLIDQIDDLGKTIFGGILSPFQQNPQAKTTVKPEEPTERYANRPNLVRVERTPAAESTLEPVADRATQQTSQPSSPSFLDQLVGPKVDPRGTKTSRYANAYPPEVKSPTLGDDRSMPRETAEPSAPKSAAVAKTAPVAKAATEAEMSPAPATDPVASKQQTDASFARLHERLSILRESPFDDFPSLESPTKAPAAADSADQPAAETETAKIEATPTAPAQEEQPHATATAASRPHLADQSMRAEPAAETEPEEEPVAAVEPKAAEITPSIAQPPAVAETPVDNNTPAVTARTTTPEESAEEKVAAKAAPAGEDVLITRESPVLNVRTIGPRRITVGKASTFVVTINNSGPVAAHQTVVTIDLPEWTDVAGTKSTAGTAGWVQTAATARQFQWIVGELESKGSEQLTLEVVPLKSQPFDLAVRWNYKPVVTQALIEVQEPRLEVRLEGPRQILYGAKQVYRLEIANTGTGDADNVEISLMPVGVGPRSPATHKLGQLQAGTNKAVEVELTAHQDGELTVEVEARGDAGAEARLVEKIVVVRPALHVEVQAPPVQYAGSVVTYQIRVSNPGTAVADNVKIVAMVPTGARHESANPPATLSPEGKQVTWTLDSLAPGASVDLAVNCRLEQAGTRMLTVRSSADGDLVASADASTLVETIADLVLDVQDPVGPIPVGSDATYKVNIQNRGSRTAEDVEVIAYFSDGIEPTSAEGAESEIGTGQVVFQKVPSLEVGKDLALVIHAKAEQAGNHVFRVEVYCKESGIRLVSEEMTHYYAGFDGTQQAARQSADYLRTAERPQPDESAQ